MAKHIEAGKAASPPRQDLEGSMFNVGDKVWIEDSAREDIGLQAFYFIKTHPYATVKQRFVEPGMPEAQAIYALEWGEKFPGGWDVYGTCKPGQGQQVTSKHLSLDFEGSRKVVTVPRPVEFVDLVDKALLK